MENSEGTDSEDAENRQEPNGRKRMRGRKQRPDGVDIGPSQKAEQPSCRVKQQDREQNVRKRAEPVVPKNLQSPVPRGSRDEKAA